MPTPSSQDSPATCLTVSETKQKLDQFSEHQKQQFLEHQPINDLVVGRSNYIDGILVQLWQSLGLATYQVYPL